MSALSLLQLLVNKPPAEATIVLDVQSQMVDGGQTLAETAVGQEMDTALTRERTKFEEELAQTRTDRKEALALDDQESAALLAEHEQETDYRIRQLKEEQGRLKITMERLHEEKLAELKAELDKIREENQQTSVALVRTRQQHEEDRAMFERARATSLNVEMTLSLDLEEAQKRLSELAHDPSTKRTQQGPDTSVSLFGVYYSWVAPSKSQSYAYSILVVYLASC